MRVRERNFCKRLERRASASAEGRRVAEDRGLVSE